MAVVGGRWGAAALAALGIAASASSAAAYTVKQTSSGATVRWHAPAVSVRIDPSMGNYFKDVPVQGVITDAAQAWAGLPGVPDVLVSEGEPGPKGYESKSKASNGVYLIEDWQLAESSLAVTVATFETKSGKIVDTDILVNANHPFALLAAGPDAPADDFDLRGVLTHEFGHVLGLGESYDVRLATMWPNVARGETHQRDIHEDDEMGVETAYAQAVAAESSSDGGCGGASVIVRRGQGMTPSAWLLLGAGLIGAGWWLRTRSRAGRRGAPMLALVVLFGAPFQGDSSDTPNTRVEVLRTLALRRMGPMERSAGLASAAKSKSQQVRLAAAAVLERSGVREDVSTASALANDGDAEVRRVALLAIERLRTAPPAARIAAGTSEAKSRLKALLGDATDLVQGEAVNSGVRMQDGLIWSRYKVSDKARSIEIEIAGGTLGELTQVVSEQEPPADGSQIVVAQRKQGRPAWAHLRDGVVYGGFLGDGPAIEWQP